MPRLLVALAVAALALAWPPRAGATEQTAHTGTGVDRVLAQHAELVG